MKRYITYGYMTLALFFVLVLHKGINDMPYSTRYVSHVWSGAAPYYGIEVEYITPEEVERRRPKLHIVRFSGRAEPKEIKRNKILLKEPRIDLPIQKIQVDLLHEPNVQPGEIVNASAAASLSENHLHD